MLVACEQSTGGSGDRAGGQARADLPSACWAWANAAASGTGCQPFPLRWCWTGRGRAARPRRPGRVSSRSWMEPSSCDADPPGRSVRPIEPANRVSPVSRISGRSTSPASLMHHRSPGVTRACGRSSSAGRPGRVPAGRKLQHGRRAEIAHRHPGQRGTQLRRQRRPADRPACTRRRGGCRRARRPPGRTAPRWRCDPGGRGSGSPRRVADVLASSGSSRSSASWPGSTTTQVAPGSAAST